MNLLLLPWKNPTVVASAPPNFEFVKEFVRENQLDYEVICLQDLYDKEVLEHEVLEALLLCRFNAMEVGRSSS